MRKGQRYFYQMMKSKLGSIHVINDSTLPKTFIHVYCLWPCSLAITSTGRVHLKAQPAVVFVLKCLRRLGQSLKVSSDRLEEAGNRTCDPSLTRHRFIPYTTAALKKCLLR